MGAGARAGVRAKVGRASLYSSRTSVQPRACAASTKCCNTLRSADSPAASWAGLHTTASTEVWSGQYETRATAEAPVAERAAVTRLVKVRVGAGGRGGGWELSEGEGEGGGE